MENGFKPQGSGLPPDITGLIGACTAGEPGAFNRLVEAAYPELHRIAFNYLRSERNSHTLQCTALINEAYLRLVRAPAKEWQGRAHFFGFAARLMRGILVDYARARSAGKRGAGALTVMAPNTDSPVAADTSPDLIDLDTALAELEQLDEVQSRIVELRFFGGLSIEETAEVMGISASTVKRDWIMAKTWIHRRLAGSPSAG